jgi:hypothetical protein
MLGDIAEPQLIRRISGEVPLHEIIMNPRTYLAVLAALLAKHAPQPILRADPPGGALGHRLPGIAGLLDQVAVAELGILAVGVE